MGKALVRALSSDELASESPAKPKLRRVTVEGVDVLLGRLSSGTVVAFATRCPHQQTDLADATFFDGLVRCPQHAYLYDARTGENVVPAREAQPADLWKLKPGYLPVHPVEERDGWIWVGVEPEPPPAAYDATREQPPRPRAGPVEHPPTALRVAPGATFELRLPITPRPGFMWRVETGGPLLAVVEERDDFGDPPRHLVRVAAMGAGESTLRCTYARPWDAEGAEVRTYLVRIESA